MNAIKPLSYKPSLNEKTRVRLNRVGHPENSHSGVILCALQNPSNRRENQWYDVRFASGVLGRFLERYLEYLPQGMDQGKVPEGSQTAVA
jgi:hypothetical protein